MSARDELRRQRQHLLNKDRKLARALAHRYGTAWTRIRAKLDRLLDQIEAAKARGETVDAGWLAQHRTLEDLERLSLAELRVYVEFADRTISQAALDSFLDGKTDAETLVRSSLPPGYPFGKLDPALPIRQVEELFKATREGAPLRDLLEHLGAEQARRARGVLIEGVTLGRGPRQIARDLRDSFGGDQVRALRVARTETIRAYRRAAHTTYRQNRNVVAGWVWVAELTDRTCPTCIAMHGTEHPADEMLLSHPSCRCSPAPLTRTWSELGFPDVPETRLDVGSGEEWFVAQPDSLQRRILGPGKHDAYKAGKFRLADVPVPTVDPVWGPGLRERPLRDLVTA